MLKTFNCGVGFCIIVDANDVNKIKKKFSKKYMPYEIGYISKGNEKLNLFNSIEMVKKRACVFISGQGSNLKSLIQNTRDYNFPININLVVSTN